MSGDLWEAGQEIDLPGGPDNLSLDASGGMWIDVAPGMAAATGYALGHRDIAPSMVLRIQHPEAATPAVQRVFSDDGQLISAASSAAYYEGAGGRRLLVCAPFQDLLLGGACGGGLECGRHDVRRQVWRGHRALARPTELPESSRGVGLRPLDVNRK